MNPSSKSFCVVYSLSLFLSFFISIPAGMNSSSFHGHCILFAKGSWSSNISSEELTVTWGKTSNCNYIICMGITSMLMSLIFLWKNTLFICKGYEGTPFYSFVNMIVNAVVMFGLFISSFMISLGYNAWCDLLLSKSEEDTVCWKVELKEFDKKYNVQSEDFSTDLELVEFGAWTSSFAWFAASLLSFLKVRYFHKNEELLKALAIEKDILIPHRLRYRRIGEEDSDITNT